MGQSQHWSCWRGGTLEGPPVSPPVHAKSSTAGCSRPCNIKVRVYPGMEFPQPLWATCSHSWLLSPQFSPLSGWSFLCSSWWLLPLLLPVCTSDYVFFTCSEEIASDSKWNPLGRPFLRLSKPSSLSHSLYSVCYNLVVFHQTRYSMVHFSFAEELQTGQNIQMQSHKC